MKIAVLIPDRGDRPLFLQNCLSMLSRQSRQPDEILIFQTTPKDDQADITYRYRRGYAMLRNNGFDIIFLVENDDYYSPHYIEVMIDAWNDRGRPDIFGTNYTFYYHIRLRKYYLMEHFRRASAMNTMIKPDLLFSWCPDNEPFTDLHLWKVVKGITFAPSQVISIGIKHGVGKCGGRSHTDRFDRYRFDDSSLQFLRSNTDKESFQFYSNYINQLTK